MPEHRVRLPHTGSTSGHEGDCGGGLKGVVWRRDWTVQELVADGCYHPIKDVDRHAVLREQVRSRRAEQQQSLFTGNRVCDNSP